MTGADARTILVYNNLTQVQQDRYNMAGMCKALDFWGDGEVLTQDQEDCVTYVLTGVPSIFK